MKFFYGVYLLGLVFSPILAIASLFTDGWTRFNLCATVTCLSPIVFFFQAIHIYNWLDARKHGVKLSKLLMFGANPLICIGFILNIPSYIWALLWKLSTDDGFWEYFTDLSPIIVWVILVYAVLNKGK